MESIKRISCFFFRNDASHATLLGGSWQHAGTRSVQQTTTSFCCSKIIIRCVEAIPFLTKEPATLHRAASAAAKAFRIASDVDGSGMCCRPYSTQSARQAQQAHTHTSTGSPELKTRNCTLQRRSFEVTHPSGRGWPNPLQPGPACANNAPRDAPRVTCARRRCHHCYCANSNTQALLARRATLTHLASHSQPLRRAFETTPPLCTRQHGCKRPVM